VIKVWEIKAETILAEENVALVPFVTSKSRFEGRGKRLRIEGCLVYNKA